MSDEPCTLFWPRSGSSAAPGRPTLPVMSERLQISCTTSEPYRCSVTPRPQLIELASDSPKMCAASTMSAAGMPVISSTASGVYVASRST